MCECRREGVCECRREGQCRLAYSSKYELHVYTQERKVAKVQRGLSLSYLLGRVVLGGVVAEGLGWPCGALEWKQVW